MPRRIVTADEQDVHGGARRMYASLQRAGKTKKVKRATNRRERREGRAETRSADQT